MSTTRDGLAGFQTSRGTNSAGACYTSADATGATEWLTPAPSTGASVVITDILVSTDTAMQIDILEESSGTLLARGFLPANSGINQVTLRGKLKLGSGRRPRVLASVAGNIAVQTLYTIEGANAPI